MTIASHALAFLAVDLPGLDPMPMKGRVALPLQSINKPLTSCEYLNICALTRTENWNSSGVLVKVGCDAI